MNALKHFSLSLLCLLVISSCIKDEIEVKDLSYNIHPEFGVPIATAHIAADRLIQNFDEDGYIQTDANGQIHLLYRDTLKEISAGDLLNVSDQQFSDTADLSALEYTQLIGTGSVTIQDDKTFPLNLEEGDKLDSIRFQNGNLNLNIHTAGSFPISGSLHIYNPDNTEVISIDFSDNTPPIAIENTVDFTNLLFELTHNEEISNGLRIAYDITLTNENGGTSEPVYIDLSLRDFSIKSAGGYIVPREFNLNDQDVALNLFNDPPVGSIRIEDPRLNFNIDNGFGIGLGIRVYSLFGKNANNGIMTIDGANINQLPNVAGAPAVGQYASTTLSLTNDFMNPSLTDFLAFMPNYVSGDFALAVNPDDNQSVWVSNESTVNINFEADIPIYGSVSDFLLVDTAALTLGDLIKDANDVSEVEQLDVRLIVDNGLPLDAGVQIIFTDDNYNHIDALLPGDDNIFNSAPLNLSVSETDSEYGRAIGSTRTITDISVPKSRIQGLENATKMIIRIYGHTSDNGAHPIRLFSNDFFDVQLGAKAILNLNSDD